MALLPPQRHPLPTPSDDDSTNINNCFDMLFSADKEQQLDGLIRLRKLLSMETNPPIQEIIDTGKVPRILEFLGWDHDPKFQFESAWAITNICSGTSQHVAYIVQIGGLEPIGKLLNSNSTEVVDQAVWAIGNIAGDSVYYRDLCLNQGFMEKFITTIAKFYTSTSIIRNAVWGLSNLIRGKPCPAYPKVAAALPVLSQVLVSFHNNMEIVTDALWGISYLSEMDPQQIINMGCVPILISYLGHTSAQFITPALRALGNIVTGNDYQTSVVLNSPGFLPLIFGLTSGPKKGIKKEAFWTLSNIAAGNPQQIQTILDVPDFMEILKQGLNSTVEIATEVAWCWTNFASGASLEQIKVLIKKYDCIGCLCTILSNPKPKVKMQAVDAAVRILGKVKNTPEFHEYLQQFEDTGLYDKIVSDLPKKGEFTQAVKDFEAFFEDFEYDNPTKKNTKTTGPKTDEEKAASEAKTKAEKIEDSSSSEDEEDEVKAAGVAKTKAEKKEDSSSEEDEGDEGEEDDEEEEEEEEEEDESDDENNPYNNPARED